MSMYLSTRELTLDVEDLRKRVEALEARHAPPDLDPLEKKHRQVARRTAKLVEERIEREDA